MAVENVSETLLNWYDANARALPWRVPPGVNHAADPYAVWLSEVMLQQTTVAAVTPYFQRFMARWPDVSSLAAADDAEVMAAWAGLGYYSRARNLLACARRVTAEHGGHFPADEKALLRLPGIGAYTAAAIAAIAFCLPATVVDGNVERVVARLNAFSQPLPGARTVLRDMAANLTPAIRPGDFAQAMMDLGATICTPRGPACGRCPLTSFCKAREAGNPAAYPVKAPKAQRPERTGTAYWIEQDGMVLLVRRPPKGLLGGMCALPTAGWETGSTAPAVGRLRVASAKVRHIFTHFALTLSVAIMEDAAPETVDGEWWPVARLDEAGLPTLFVKAAQIAMNERRTPSQAAA